MSVQLQDELERAFGDGPEHRPVEQAIRSGRRALRVRRTLGGVAALAVVGALGTTYALVAPTSTPDAAVGVTDQTPASSEPIPATVPGPPDLPRDDEYVLADDQLGELTPDGLALRPGDEVTAHVPNPFRFPAPHESVALVVEGEAGTSWLVLTMTYTEDGQPDGSSVAVSGPDDFDGTFEEWVQQDVDANLAASPDGLVPFTPADADAPPAAEYGDHGVLVLADGVEVNQQIEDPLGPGDEPGFDSVALDVDRGGQRQWLLLQTDDSGGMSVAENQVARFAGFEEWLDDQVRSFWWQHAVAFADGRTLVAARPDVEILVQRGVSEGKGPRAAIAIIEFEGDRRFASVSEVEDGAGFTLSNELPPGNDDLPLAEQLQAAYEMYGGPGA